MMMEFTEQAALSTRKKERRLVANQRFRKIENNLWLKKYIIHKLQKKYWSPEQISERLKIEYPNNKNKWIGKDRKSRLITNVDRLSGFSIVERISTTTAKIIHAKLEERFRKIPKNKKFTYTYDNGREIGVDDPWLESKIKMEIFRVYPYRSWERGCNENFNGLVREFFPKGTNFAKITDQEIRKVEKLLNNRPRKRLNYSTPKEVFNGKDFKKFNHLFD